MAVPAHPPRSAADLHAHALELWARGDGVGALLALREAVGASVDLELVNDLGVAAHALLGADAGRAVLLTALLVDPEREDAAANLAAIESAPAAWRTSPTLGGPDPEMPERAFPGLPHPKTMAEHALRYAFALERVHGKHVLDLGCGTGYGSEMLTWTAASVRGFDLWQPVDEGRPSWPGGADLSFGHDLCRDPLPQAECGVMFEVLEHLADAPTALRLAWEAVDTLVLSFPNPVIHGSHHNPYHVNDWPLDEVERRVTEAASTRFARVELEHFQQEGDGSLRPGRDPNASYWLIVARGVGAVERPVVRPATLAAPTHMHELRADPTRGVGGAVELISVHVPKCAGTSFHRTLAAVYGPDEVGFDMEDDLANPECLFRSDFAEWTRRNMETLHAPFRWPRVVTGHFWLGKYAPRFPDAKTVVWLRDPAARLISWFHYWRAAPLDDPSPIRAAVVDGSLPIEEFLELDVVRDQVSRTFLDCYTLDDLDFVGIHEHFDEDLAALGELLGWPTVEAPRVNPTEGAEYAGYSPSADLLRKIRALNPDDTELYERALALRAARARV